MNNVLSIFPHAKSLNGKEKLLYGCIVSYGKNTIPIKLSRQLSTGFFIIVNDKIRGPIKYYIINQHDKSNIFEIFHKYGIDIIPYKNFTEYYEFFNLCEKNYNRIIAVAESLFEDIKPIKYFYSLPIMISIPNNDQNYYIENNLNKNNDKSINSQDYLCENEYEIIKSIDYFIDTLIDA